MDSMQNELLNLRRELDAFRNENIYLHNELVKQNKILCEEIISLREHLSKLYEMLSKQHLALENEFLEITCGKKLRDRSLQIYLNQLVGMQAAELVLKEMPEVKTFENKLAEGFVVSEEYLRYVLSQTEDSGNDLFLEFGVLYGRSITLTAWTLPDKIIYGFDSFEGLPENFGHDLPKGSFNQNGKAPNVPDNVRLIKGWFDKTLPAFVREHPQKCAFIHVDCDCYSSTKIIFDNLKNQIGAGTVIAFDEYFNYPGWQQYEYKAFMEFVAENNIEFEYIARTDFQQVAVRII